MDNFTSESPNEADQSITTVSTLSCTSQPFLSALSVVGIFVPRTFALSIFNLASKDIHVLGTRQGTSVCREAIFKAMFLGDILQQPLDFSYVQISRPSAAKDIYLGSTTALAVICIHVNSTEPEAICKKVIYKVALQDKLSSVASNLQSKHTLPTVI
ncbi:hypothetical protein J6590_053100 [Homalodisca vitripennis]|nr:hypothetical protein J6590_053100 [Homalodisca vitripennis]